MTKLNTRGLGAELSLIAAGYGTVEELEASIGRAQVFLDGLTPEQPLRARAESVVAKLQRIRAHHYEAAG